jgi:hypothetical protein
MKRLVLLLFALFLMFDLAEDGCLGKAAFVPSHSQDYASVTSLHHAGSDKADSRDEVATADLRGPPSQGRSQPVTPVDLPTFRPIDYCHFGSSGDIPLLLAFPPAHSPTRHPYSECQKFFPLRPILQERKSPLAHPSQRGEISKIPLKVPLCQRGIEAARPG